MNINYKVKYEAFTHKFIRNNVIQVVNKQRVLKLLVIHINLSERVEYTKRWFYLEYWITSIIISIKHRIIIIKKINKKFASRKLI